MQEGQGLQREVSLLWSNFFFVIVVVVVILKREFLVVWTFLAMDLISTVLDLFTPLIM